MEQELWTAFYEYAAQCFIDKNAIKGVKSLTGGLTDEQVVEVLALAHKEFHKFYKLQTKLV